MTQPVAPRAISRFNVPPMATRLWEKGEPLDPEVLEYTVGDDWLVDAWLVEEDCWGSLAHARMLREVGLLSEPDRRAIADGLRDVLARKRGAEGFAISPQDEDVHTALEAHLQKRSGDAGRRVHTGRSRNDQVLTCVRLFTKRRLDDLATAVVELATALLEQARRHERAPLPGYTHMRQAMPSSIGLWASQFAEMLVEDLDAIHAARAGTDRSPLGSAAGFGVPLPLDRARTAELLGFASVQTNCQAVQSSRGKAESQALFAAVQVAHTLAKLSWDLELYSSPEFGFVRLPGNVATGSSIMPQKRNPDVLEISRANAAVLESNLQRVLAVAGRLPSSYHRDYQLTKEPLVKGLLLARQMVRAMTKVVSGLEWDVARCDALVTDEAFGAHHALALAAEGVPFRDAYKKAAEALAKGEVKRPADLGPALATYRVAGAAGNLMLDRLTSRLEQARARAEEAREAFAAKLRALEQDRT
jgi:argininosuccinate lyase